jgi:hypothetical protein
LGKRSLFYYDRYIIDIPPPLVRVGKHRQLGEGAKLRLHSWNPSSPAVVAF